MTSLPIAPKNESVQDAELQTTSPAGCHGAGQTNDQLESPFFAKLPGELRAMIFASLFGNRRVHLEYMIHPHRSDAVGNTHRWRSGICERPASDPFRKVVLRPHYCLAGYHWLPLHISILFTCKRAYEEGAPVLYHTNHFLITNQGGQRRLVDDLHSLQLKSPFLWSRMRSLELVWNCR